MEPQVYLAIDLGASSGRVMAALWRESRLQLEEVHRFGNGAVEREGSWYWDFDGLMQEILQGLTQAAKCYTGQITSIGVDTWGVDYGLVDAQGELLSQPYSYRDKRTEGVPETVYEKLPFSELYAITGIQHMPINTLFQLVTEQREQPERLAKAHRCLMIADLVNLRLTGRMVQEYTNASTTQLLDAEQRQWSAPLIEKLGLPTQLFGELIQPGETVGTLTPEVAELTGLGTLPVIAVGSHDTASAVAAVPAKQADFAYISSGTWSLMGLECAGPVLNAASERYSLTNEGGVSGDIRLLKNIAGMWLIQECRRSWAEQNQHHSFEELSELAQKAGPAISFILPDDPLFATPGNMPERIHAFCRRTEQAEPHSPGQCVRIILESLACRYRSVLEMLEEATEQTVSLVHILGGGCRNQLLNQLSADLLQRPVIAGPVEATALGNVLLQMVASGAIGSLEEGRSLVADSFESQRYEPSQQPVEPRWEAYQALEANQIPT